MGAGMMPKRVVAAHCHKGAPAKYRLTSERLFDTAGRAAALSSPANCGVSRKTAARFHFQKLRQLPYLTRYSVQLMTTTTMAIRPRPYQNIGILRNLREFTFVAFFVSLRHRCDAVHNCQI